MEGGWVKLYRKTKENPIVMKDAEHIAIWVWLLMTATHKPHDSYHNGQRITLNPGQLVTGRKKISTELGISESKVERVLTCFEIEHQIEQQKCSKNRLITILNWVSYQESEQQTEQQLNNKWTTTEQQVNTIQECKNERMEEWKNKAYFPDEQLNNTFKDYVVFRKKIKKPMTDKAIELAIKKLSSLSGGDNDKAIAILNQSILQGWSGLFELKEEKKKGIDWDSL